MEFALDVAVFWGVVAALIGFLYGPWQRFWVDWYRDEIFSARDKLFDLAVSGKISFSDEAYRGQRESLNAMIRFADKSTWTHFALMALLIKALRASYQGSFRPVKTARNPSVKQVVAPASRAFIISMIARGPLLWPFILPTGLLGLWHLASSGASDTDSLAFKGEFWEMEELAARISLT